MFKYNFCCLPDEGKMRELRADTRCDVSLLWRLKRR